MARIEIYTSPLCGFCHAAKRLMQQLNLDFEEIDLMQHPERRDEMLARSEGRQTVPQIFIDSKGIGGSDELHALHRSGELDGLLNPPTVA